MTLNEIELREFARIMERLRSEVYYVDAIDVDERRFGEGLRRLIPFEARIVSKHKADEIYPVVSAASIVAKVKREERIKRIKEELEGKLNLPLGSGYPADLVTRRFIREWVNRFDSLPPYVRRSWKTVRRL